MEFLLNLDQNIFFFFQRLQRPELDYVLAWPTYLGATLITLSLVVFGILIFDRKNGAGKIAAATVGILITHWISNFLKMVFHRPRPHILWPQIHVIFEKPHNDAFPSGHTAVAFAAAFLLTWLYPGKLRWTYGIAFWVAVTRIYVGAHYPSDLIGGALIGFICAFWGFHLSKNIKKGMNEGDSHFLRERKQNVFD